MYDAVEDEAVFFAGGGVAEDAAAEGGAVEGKAGGGGFAVAFAIAVSIGVGVVGGARGFGGGCGVGGRSGEEQVRRCGGEVGEDGGVAGGAWLDDFSGEEVGVDDREGVGGLGEEAGDGRFAGCDGAGEADEEHGGDCDWMGGGVDGKGGEG